MGIATRLERLERRQPSADTLDIVAVGTKDEAAEMVRQCEAAGKRKPGTIVITGVKRAPEWSSWARLLPVIAEKGRAIHEPGPRSPQPYDDWRSYRE